MRGTSKRIRGGILSLLLPLAACGGGDAPAALGVEGAHEHGVARLNMAIDGSEALIEFTSPAQGIYGFEYRPTSPEDLQRQADGLATLRMRFAEALAFDPGLGCTVEAIQVGVVGEAAHAHEDEHAHGDEHAHDSAHAHDEEHAHEDEHAHDSAHAHDDEHAHDTTGGAAAEHAHAEGDAHDEVRGEFRVLCERPLSGTRLTLSIGTLFPGIANIDVQVIGDRPTGGRYPASGSTIEL